IGGREILSFLGHSGWINSLAVSPNGRRLATASLDGTARVWDMASGAASAGRSGQGTRTLQRHTAEGWSVAVTSKGQRIASGSLDGTARLWDLASGRQLLRLNGHPYAMKALAVTPDGQQIITGSSDGTVRVWDAVSRHQIREFKDDTGIHSMALTS